MLLKKMISSAIFLCTLTALSLSAAEASSLIGVVNFSSCVTDSKYGKQEQTNLESVRKEFTTLVENTEKELKEISQKFEDSDFLDGLSPDAETELKLKFQSLNEDYSRYQNQFYQIMNHANYQLVQKITAQVSRASEQIAKRKNLAYVMNKEACFYHDEKLDITPSVIVEMDKNFEQETPQFKLSENEKAPVLPEVLNSPGA